MTPKPQFIFDKEIENLVTQTKKLTYNLYEIELEEHPSKAFKASSTMLIGKVLTIKIFNKHQVIMVVHKA